MDFIQYVWNPYFKSMNNIERRIDMKQSGVEAASYKHNLEQQLDFNDILKANDNVIKFKPKDNEDIKTDNSTSNMYFVRIIYHNNSIISISTKDGGFKSVRNLYNTVKSWVCKSVQRIQLISRNAECDKILYDKKFELPEYHADNVLKMMRDTLEQIEVCQNYFESINMNQALFDKAVDVMEHNIENSNFEDGMEIQKLFISLKETLTSRRQLKNSIAIKAYMKTEKSMGFLKSIDINLEKQKLEKVENRLNKKIEEGMEKWKEISNKIIIVPFKTEEDIEKLKTFLKKYNNNMIDKYNKNIIAYDSIYKN